jgi:hypothetical protein
MYRQVNKLCAQYSYKLLRGADFLFCFSPSVCFTMVQFEVINTLIVSNIAGKGEEYLQDKIDGYFVSSIRTIRVMKGMLYAVAFFPMLSLKCIPDVQQVFTPFNFILSAKGTNTRGWPQRPPSWGF